MLGRRLVFLHIRWKGCQTRIWHASAQCEVIKALVAAVPEAEHLMHRVVEKTANAGGLNAASLGLEIKQLPDSTTFPVKSPVKQRAIILKRRREFSQHGHGEHAVGGDLLVTAHALGKFTAVAGHQPIYR